MDSSAKRAAKTVSPGSGTMIATAGSILQNLS